MSKSMLVNVVNDEESRIAIVADGRLEELSIETAQQKQIEGNIYKARIVKVIASLDAVFVDYGRERNGFLAVPDVHQQYFRGEKRDVEVLQKGQELLVQVKKGENFGIAGPNGAGKSTLFNVIAGFYPPTSGKIVFDGHNITRLNSHQVCRKGIARTFQIPTTFHTLTVYQNIQVGATFGAGRRNNLE